MPPRRCKTGSLTGGLGAYSYQILNFGCSHTHIPSPIRVKFFTQQCIYGVLYELLHVKWREIMN